MASLSLLIPNYNRPNSLRKLLASLYAEIDGHSLSSYVDVVVVDDYSMEDITSTINAFRERKNFYFAMQNEKCGNAEKAFFSALEFINTDYVWLFGNDDLLLPNGLLEVIGAIVSYNPSFILLNPVLKREEFSFVGIKSLIPVVYYDKTTDLFSDFGFMSCTTTFSCLVSKTSKLKEFNKKNNLSNVSSVYSHSFSLHAAFSDVAAVFISTPAVAFSMSEAGEEHVKLQAQVPEHVMYYHQTIGISRLINASSQVTGIPISWYGSTVENEINKNDFNVYKNSLGSVILRFFLEQLIREKMNTLGNNMNFNYLAADEIMEMRTLFTNFRDSYLLQKFEDALEIYARPDLTTALSVAHLSSFQRRVHLGGMHKLKLSKFLSNDNFNSLTLSKKSIVWSLLRGFS